MIRRSRFHPLSIAGVAMATLLAIGCQSRQLTPSSLPSEYRAAAGAGRQQMRLNGLQSAGALSSAISPADVLELTILTGLPDDLGEPIAVRVGDDGRVEAPQVGPVPVAGLEPTQAARRIAATAIERGVFRRPQVSISIAEQATHRVTVLGAVSEPGVHEVPRGSCNILTAIAVAGGFTEESGSVVEVLRHGGALGPTLATEPTSQGEVQQASFEPPPPQGVGAPAGPERIDLAVDADRARALRGLGDQDVLVVRPREKRVIHVSGLVKEPNQFELPEDHDLRLLDAVAMAGGQKNPIADKAIVIRTIEGLPEPVVVRASLAAAKRNTRDNLMLQPGDLVSIEPTPASVAYETFVQLFRVTMGISSDLTVF